MNRTQIPLYSYPITLMLVDDDMRFLKSLALRLEASESYILRDDAQKALKFLEEEYRPFFNMDTFLKSQLESSKYGTGYQPLRLDNNAIFELISKPNRFEDIGIVIIDYDMPGINGVDFCKKIPQKQIKRIMLTGAADNNTAIQAFNDHFIDKFIVKGSSNQDLTLNDGVKEQHDAYFIDLTLMATKTFLLECSQCLTDPAFISLFNKIYHKYNIVEHYLLEETGSFLLIDKQGNLFWFIVRNDEDLEVYTSLGKEYQVSADLLNDIKLGKKVPYFPDTDSWNAPWEDSCHPATKIDALQPYYYTVIEGGSNKKVPQPRVFSFEEYLEQKQA